MIASVSVPGTLIPVICRCGGNTKAVGLDCWIVCLTIADFEQRIQDALQDFGNSDSIQFNLKWKTIAQAKQLKSKISQAQKQLRLIKKDVNFAQKVISVTYTAEIAKVGKDFGAVISTEGFGKKATG